MIGYFTSIHIKMRGLLFLEIYTINTVMTDGAIDFAVTHKLTAKVNKNGIIEVS